ncbi:hypothetical protein KY321_00670 [Candidatus Woesearchaeota archaeon]|nr:hypothetical protein [Candidatus Woesearchaeota archaeon]
MSNDRTINWEELPHENFLGHGIEGLVLRLDDKKCIKIYSPDKENSAEREFFNYYRLRKKGFLVPKPFELVNIYIGGKSVKLPKRDEFMGIGLYTHCDVNCVPAVIKEYFPGTPYGKKKPTINELKGLVNYLNNLHRNNLTFSDGIALDFISSDKRTALVDCSTLMDKEECEDKYSCDFIYISQRYQERILSDLENELTYNRCKPMSFKLKLIMAELLSNFK